MNIYLAGGLTGNLQPLWAKAITGGGNIIETMESFGVDFQKKKNGNLPCKSSQQTLCNQYGGVNILESFYYVRNNRYFPKLYPYLENFMLDSGAFTFMQDSKITLDWMKYTEDYADFINKYDIQLFFELDIDKIVGLDKVEQLRNRLEQLTGKKPIPVWHETRDKTYWLDMCKNYPYVAVGGLAISKGNKKKALEKGLPYFIKSAHDAGAKIHGLGYTSVNELKRLHFDSVDSKAWLHGNIGGWLYKFNPNTGLMDKWKQTNQGRMKSREGAIHNFNEWVKFCNYAKIYL